MLFFAIEFRNTLSNITRFFTRVEKELYNDKKNFFLTTVY